MCQAQKTIVFIQGKEQPNGHPCHAGRYRVLRSFHTMQTRKDTGQMTIRHTTPADYGRIQEIYAYAREQMRQAGNPSQWGHNRPSGETLLQDIQNGQSHVLEEKGQICGVFTFIIGEDPTYRIIEQGQWLNAAPYGTIHRIAANGAGKGIFRECLAYCLALIPNIRIDTHRDNAAMRHLLEKHGFRKCGPFCSIWSTRRAARE